MVPETSGVCKWSCVLTGQPLANLDAIDERDLGLGFRGEGRGNSGGFTKGHRGGCHTTGRARFATRAVAASGNEKVTHFLGTSVR